MGLVPKHLPSFLGGHFSPSTKTVLLGDFYFAEKTEDPAFPLQKSRGFLVPLQARIFLWVPCRGGLVIWVQPMGPPENHEQNKYKQNTGSPSMPVGPHGPGVPILAPALAVFCLHACVIIPVNAHLFKLGFPGGSQTLKNLPTM